MKKILFIILGIILIGIGAWYIFRGVLWYKAGDSGRAEAQAREEAIERVLEARRSRVEKNNENVNPFGEDGIARILLLGLDKRVGQTSGHCDVIQMFTIDTKKQNVTITAVPRGTYSPLPPGTGTTSSDYYVSNSCGLGGIEYGINQIEKIAGMKADYVVIVGFSETLGILRSLKLPTTETLQWLRQRHAYAIGEPQRAHNHSTFLKEMIVKYMGNDVSRLDKALHYIVYKTVQTDLSFDEAEAIVKSLGDMKISERPEDITLAMRPAHLVSDIPYIPEKLGEYLEKTLGPIKNHLSKKDYSGTSNEQIQETLFAMIEDKKKDPEFIIWAFENNLWLQIEDDQKRLEIQYDMLEKYITQLEDEAKRREIIGDYIIEMGHLGETGWETKGKELLEKELKKN